MVQSPALIVRRAATISKLIRFSQSSMASQIKPKAGNNRETDSDLFRIEDAPSNPFTLFKKWQGQHYNGNNLLTNTVCLSTATKDGRVSSRNLILRRLDEDGFVIMTDKRSKKAKELDENPNAAMAFLYVKETNGEVHSRQIRAEGKMHQLADSEWSDIYSEEPLFCKIRAYVCNQGSDANWTAMKEHHDKLMKEFEEGKNDLPKPDHVVAYKMLPTMFDFYETSGARIADRLIYLRSEDIWETKRIAA